MNLAKHAVTIILALCFAAPAAAQQAERDLPRTVAFVLIQALAPSDYGDWAYNWGPVSARTAQYMHWHIYEPDPRDRRDDVDVRRNGWVGLNGRNVGISAFGRDVNVTAISAESHDFDNEAMLAALRAEGASVEMQGDDEGGTEYWVVAPGRKRGVLRSERHCTSARSAAAQRCRWVFAMMLDRADG